MIVLNSVIKSIAFLNKTCFLNEDYGEQNCRKLTIKLLHHYINLNDSIRLYCEIKYVEMISYSFIF